METYVPPEKKSESNQSTLEGAHFTADNSNYMMEGGFDSFSSEENSHDEMTLGKVDYDAIHQEQNLWSKRSDGLAMSFWQQAGNSLVPALYRNLQYRTKQQAVAFVKAYIKFTMLITLAMMLLLMLMNMSGLGGGGVVVLIQFIIIAAILATVGVWLAVLLYRFIAWLLSLFGKLFAVITKKRFVRDQIYVAALYIMVFPYTIANVISNLICSVWMWQNNLDVWALTRHRGTVFSITCIPLAVCLIYMLLAVIFMESDA